MQSLLNNTYTDPIEIDKENSPIQLMHRADYAFCIIDRQIKVMKSRTPDLMRGDKIIDSETFSNLLSYLILNFTHPVYLPTIDEVVKIDIRYEIDKIIKRFSNELP